MNLKLRRPFVSLKERKQQKAFQEEVDRPLRVPGNQGIPRIISVQTISTSIDVSDKRLDSSNWCHRHDDD